MAVKALGIVTSGNRIKVEGMQEFRPVSAFTFVGRYRMIDFPMSNLSNSNIETIQIFAGENPRSLAEHVGTGRHYGINSKRGKVSLLFSDQEEVNEIYNTDIASFLFNESVIERVKADYVVIVPSYMVFAQNYATLLDEHIASGALPFALNRADKKRSHPSDDFSRAALLSQTRRFRREGGVGEIIKTSVPPLLRFLRV